MLEVPDMNSIIKCVEVSKIFRTHHGITQKSAEVKAVDSVSVSIVQDVSIGIVGESGCGKSTLAKILCGLIPPTSGNVIYKGKPFHQLSSIENRSFRKSVQMIFQDPASSLNPRFRIIDTLTEPLMIHFGKGKKDSISDCAELLDLVGLSQDDMHRYPHQFSGGQKQRISIARALASEPELLIADEPLSALDISIQSQIINLLNELKQQRKLSMLVISHDLSAIRHLCSEILVMYAGRVVETGSSEIILDSPAHPYTAALIEAVPRLDRRARNQSFNAFSEADVSYSSGIGCVYQNRCSRKGKICAEISPLLEKKGEGHFAACHFS